MTHIDLERMGAELTGLGWEVTFPEPVHLHATQPESALTYDVFGDDDIAEGCCYVNGLMVDWKVLAIIQRHLGTWAAVDSNAQQS